MYKSAIAFALLALLLPGAAGAQYATKASSDWRLVNEPEGGGAIYLRMSSVQQTTPTTRKGWFKSDYETILAKPYSSAMTFEEYDCAKRLYRLDVGIFYYRKGPNRNETQPEWAPVIPESVSEAKWEAICE